MKYRLTDVQKWNNEFYYNLDPHSKLMMEFILDHADCGGFVMEMPGMQQMLDIFKPWDEFEVLRCLENLEHSFVMIRNNNKEMPKHLWARNYLKRQRYLPLKPSHTVHRGVIKRYVEDGGLFNGNPIYDEFYQIHIQPKLKEIEQYVREKNAARQASAPKNTEQTKRLKRA